MWKIAIGFVVFAAVALYMLSKGGNIDIGGEKLGEDPTHTAPAATPAATAASKP